MMAAGGMEMLAALEASRIAEAIRDSVWAYPLLETVHIASFAALIGSVLLFELRVFGVASAIGVVPLARLALRTALIAFACAAISGALLFIPSANELAAHPAFQVKLVLILIAGLNAAVFHLRGGVRGHDAVARLQALASLVLLLAVLAAGRLIAYL
jgi:hypothetical protein